MPNWANWKLLISLHGGWPGAFQDKKEYTEQQEPLQKVAEGKEEYNRANVGASLVGAHENRADIKQRAGTSPAPTKKQITDPKDDYKTWLALSQWAKETMSINTFWINFAHDISNKLKNGTKLSEKEKTDMKKCWGQAVKKGFRKP